MAAAGACGDWSVKDVLGHLATWTSRAVTLLFNAERQQKPPGIDRVLDDWEALNAEDFAAQQDRPLDRVLADFHGSHRQLLKRLAAWDDGALFDETRHAWLRGQSVADCVREDTADHDAEHRAQIEVWLRRNNARDL